MARLREWSLGIDLIGGLLPGVADADYPGDGVAAGNIGSGAEQARGRFLAEMPRSSLQDELVGLWIELVGLLIELVRLEEELVGLGDELAPLFGALVHARVELVGLRDELTPLFGA